MVQWLVLAMVLSLLAILGVSADRISAIGITLVSPILLVIAPLARTRE